MSHTITSKLNKAAREFANQNGVTFFVSLGEKNYNYQTKQNEWTNYEAALFAKDAQIQFYRDTLTEGAIIEVTGTGLLMDASDPQYKPKLVIQDAKLGFISGGQPAQQPQQQGGYQQQPQNQQAPQYQQQQPQQRPMTQAIQQQAQQNYQQQSGFSSQQPQQAPKVNPQEPSIDFDDGIPL